MMNTMKKLILFLIILLIPSVGLGLESKGLTSAQRTAVENLSGINTGDETTGYIYLSAGGMWPSTTAGCSANTLNETSTYKINYFTLDFDSATDENAECEFAMPPNWDGGTITAVFYWTTIDGEAGETVKWYIQGLSSGNDDPIDSAFGTAVGVEDTWIANNDVHITATTGAVTLTGAGASEKVHFRIYRDVSEDTLGADAKLIGVMITYTKA